MEETIFSLAGHCRIILNDEDVDGLYITLEGLYQIFKERMQAEAKEDAEKRHE